MRPAASLDRFVRAPVGRWILGGTTVVWCHSPTLCGAIVWGRPDGVASQAALTAYDAYKSLGPAFDAVLDGSELDGLPTDSLAILGTWIERELPALAGRVRTLVGVLPRGADGLTLAGFSLVRRFSFPIELAATRREAFALAGQPALADEIEAILAGIRPSPQLHGLRALLKEREGRVPLDEAARQIGVSTRSLQRLLADAKSSFRTEVADARFEVIARMLQSTDEKIATIAARVGMTKGSLSALVRARTGKLPSAYRALARS